VDNGEAFTEQDGYEYGWGRDMTNMGRSRGINPNILLDNFIMFPPDTHTP